MNDEKSLLSKAWDITKNVVKSLPGLVKDAFITQPLRTATSIGLEITKPLFGDKWEDTIEVGVPDNKIVRFFLGNEPIKDFRTNLKYWNQKGGELAKKYVGTEWKGLGSALGTAAFLGFSAIDLTPIGGWKSLIGKEGKALLKQIAKETDENVLKGIAKDILPAASDDVIEFVAKGWKDAKNVKEVKQVLESAKKQFGKEIAKETIPEAGVKLEGKLLSEEAKQEVIKASPRLKEKYAEKEASKLFGTEAKFNPSKESEVLAKGGGNVPPDIAKQIAQEFPEPSRGKGIRGLIARVTRPEAEYDPFLKEILKEQPIFYDVEGVKDRVKQAVDYINENGVDKALNYLRMFQKGKIEDMLAIGDTLMRYYSKIGDIDRVMEVANLVDDIGRRMGRGIKTLDYLTRHSPEIIVNHLNKTLLSKGLKELSPEMKEFALSMLKKMSEAKTVPEFNQLQKELIEGLKKEVPLRWYEWLTLMRYSAMLSNPLTHLRNFVWNLTTTFITAPITKFVQASYEYARHLWNPEFTRTVYFSDVAKYIKETYTSIPQAATAAMEVFKNGYVSPGKYAEFLAKEGVEGIIRQVQYAKAPRAFTMVMNAMEASDRFFSVLIRNGAKAMLIEDAQRSGKKLTETLLRQIDDEVELIAEKWLVREKLGLRKDEANLIIRALDTLGDTLLKIKSKDPKTEALLMTFVPFVRTPVNIAKMMVEYSLLGFWGAKDGERVAKAIIGSVFNVWAWKKAFAKDEITFLPPKDPQEKRAFYDSGRKPFSIKIGNRWIPLYYFGPIAFPLAMAAGVKWAVDNGSIKNPQEFAKVVATAIPSAFRVMLDQTPLEGISEFVKIATGESDYTIGSQLGFTAEQFIPLSGLLRYVNKWLDPVYRQAKTPIDRLTTDFSEAAKVLGFEPPPAFPSAVTGEARMTPLDLLLPYRVGTIQPTFDETYKQIKQYTKEKRDMQIEAKQYAEQIFNLKYKKNDIEGAKALARQLENQPEEFKQYLTQQYKDLELDYHLRPLGLDKGIKRWEVEKRAMYLIDYFEHLKQTQGKEKARDVLNKLRELKVITPQVEEKMIEYIQSKKSRDLQPVEQ